MATYTSYLNLEKPTTSETFNLLKMNQNWDKIDAGVSALNSKFTYKDYAFESSGWSAGTIGTRAEQIVHDLQDDINQYGRVVSISIVRINDSLRAIYQAFFYSNSIYVNAYRATENASGAGYAVHVRVLYMKNN